MEKRTRRKRAQVVFEYGVCDGVFPANSREEEAARTKQHARVEPASHAQQHSTGHSGIIFFVVVNDVMLLLFVVLVV